MKRLQRRKRSSWVLWAITLAWALPIGFIALLITNPNTIAAINGGFAYSEVYSFESPDRKTELKISKRLGFPVLDMVDPAIVVKFQLIDRNGETKKERIEHFVEDSDLTEPTIEWIENKVIIRSINSRTDLVVEFANNTEQGSGDKVG
ncbi:MAG: hypothetical protein AAGJ81_13700 [Verrucomicrobiota bacterium]